jgi:hypothetical protein
LSVTRISVDRIVSNIMRFSQQVVLFLAIELFILLDIHRLSAFLPQNRLKYVKLLTSSTRGRLSHQLQAADIDDNPKLGLNDIEENLGPKISVRDYEAERIAKEDEQRRLRAQSKDYTSSSSSTTPSSSSFDTVKYSPFSR